ncbi:Thymus-specific serine protease [Mortierella alpina]|nr:Thymus-specific serine protease [Mortierella alpina]
MAITTLLCILVLGALLSLTMMVAGLTTALPENDSSSSASWSSDNVGTINRSNRSPFVKTFGLRHKPSMDWGMRARARNQVHWDKYWSELETGQEFDVLSDLDLDPDVSGLCSNNTLSHNNTTTADGNSHLQLGADAVMQTESSNDQKAGTAGMTPGLPPGDGDPGYFFTQILDHYAEPLPAGEPPAAAAKNTTTFRQRYRINAQFYKPVKDGRLKDDFSGMNARLRGSRGRGVGGRAGVWGTASATQSSNSGSVIDNETKGTNGSNTSPLTGDGGEAEGLPLDLLKYLTVDQSIEDIVYFMDHFPATHPSFFNNDDDKDNSPRWILTGCSYGGNLAAWTRQRHPSKVFAAFASSAPLRSTLDFFEYSTSQTDVFGETCASQLAHARDFLDGALLMTDGFMRQMEILDSRKATKDVENEGEPAANENATIFSRPTNTTTGPSSHWTQEARRAAKLRVLSWFSPDFAHEYAVEGEEVHAAGWIWWTVASAVQYNAVVVPPTVKPTKTVVDVLCDTMALGYKDQILQDVTQEEKSEQSPAQEASESSNNSSTKEDGDPLQAVRFARTLAIWFRNQQFFTPTRNEDLQPSDMDPNSVQNLAGMAWLWQTCSELGYLQTTHPSACCCGLTSTSFPENDSATPTNDDNGDNVSSLMANSTCKAAWQECQFYFHTTHPSPSTIHHDASIRHPNALESNNSTLSQPSSPPPMQDMSWGGPQDCSRESRSGQINDHASNNSTQILLPSNYPNVETNVNRKFHGWRIAQESYPEPSRLQCDLPTDPCLNDIHTQSTTSASSIDITAAATTVASSRARFSGSSTEFLSFRNTISSHKKKRHHLRSSGSRFYFTNGENDPWKELTLASPKALKLLSRRPRRNKLKDRRGQRRHGRNDDSSGQCPTFAFASSTKTTATMTVAETGASLSFAWSSRTVLRHRLKRRARYWRRYHRYRQLSPAASKSTDTNNSNRIDAKSKLLSNEAQDQSEDNRGESVAAETLPPLSGTVHDDHSKDALRDDEKSSEDLYEAAWWHHRSDRNELRIISGASHCQDILYESSDLDAKELREEREHVLATFVRWIEIDIRRQQRMRRHKATSTA